MIKGALLGILVGLTIDIILFKTLIKNPVEMFALGAPLIFVLLSFGMTLNDNH